MFRVDPELVLRDFRSFLSLLVGKTVLYFEICLGVLSYLAMVFRSLFPFNKATMRFDS